MKYAGKTFGKMSDTEIELAAHSLLVKIHTISGWTIPASELMDVLVNEFEKKLSESYSNVNEEEMMYAFRNKSLDIKDWGKALNLTMIDEVMIPYLENRIELSKLEEQLSKPKEIEQSKNLSDEEKAEWIMDWKQKDDINFELIPLIFYDFMEEKNLLRLSSKQKWQYTEQATTQIKTKLFNDISTCKTNDAYIAYSKFEKMEREGFTGEFKGRILNRAKRLIIYDYLKDKIQ